MGSRLSLTEICMTVASATALARTLGASTRETRPFRALWTCLLYPVRRAVLATA